MGWSWWSRMGLWVMALGALADGAFHALPVAMAPLAGPTGMHAHLAIFGGMLLVLGGVVRQGARPARRDAPIPRETGSTH